MPFKIEPLLGGGGAGGGGTPAAPARLNPSWNWLGAQPYSRDLAFDQIGNYRPGSVGGGPTTAQMELAVNPDKYRIAAPAPPVTSPAATAGGGVKQLGSMSLNLIDPFMTAQSVAGGLGAGTEHPGLQAQTFLGERDIDPFGQGASGVPSRLFDYATGWIGALYDLRNGKPITAPMPADAGVLKYNFQNDPGYWALVAAPGASDAFLAGVAQQVAGQYDVADRARLTAMLVDQFKSDRDRALGISSGDRRMDYAAKLAFTQDYVGQRTSAYSQEAATVARTGFLSAIVGALPFVGADIQEAAYKHPKAIEDAWKALTPEQRAPYFETAGFRMLASDIVVWTPLLSGLGSVEAVAMRTGGVAAKAFKVYEYTRNVTTAVMATGLTIATANWALEAAVPGYSEAFGKRLDYARPISGSNLAGLINQIGFFSSGTFGAATAARGITRLAGKVAEVAHVPTPGLPELSFFKYGYGGSVIRRELAGGGLPDPGILDLAPKATFTSRLLGSIENRMRSIYDGYVRGSPTGNAELDAITDPALRIEAANNALLRGLDSSGTEAEALVRVGAEARRPRPLRAGEEQRAHDAAVKLWRSVDDEMARVHVEEYGPGWLTRRTQSQYSAADMERYARDQYARLGGDPTKLARHNEEGWAQTIRYLHDYEYYKNNGLLHVAAQGAEEAPRLMLVQADHLFANDVDGLLARLRGDDPELAQAAAASVVRTKREAAEWFAREWRPEAGVQRTPESVPPAEFAGWLEEIRTALPGRRALAPDGSPSSQMPLNAYQAELEQSGLWTLAFKPTDEAGNAISYVRRANGRVFKSPWVDYPMGNAEAIELGNRGLLLSKIDGITRGFRTWRLVEFQKALLFRRLTPRLDVSAEQVERFHAGLMMLARETGSQPQTLGAIARATSPLGQRLVQKEIDHLVEDVFGQGQHLDRVTGRPVDFYDEIAKAYRQSFKINLTAGLTSYLKANLGEVGSMIAWASDHAYVTWRFNLSPVFKVGEVAETSVFNAVRGVRNIDPFTLALYNRVGVGKSFEPLVAEQSYDDMIRSITGQEGELRGPSALAAASEAFYARHVPEDFALRARITVEQQQAATMRDLHLGGDLPSAGWLPAAPDRVVTPDSIPEGWSTKLADHRPDLLNADELADDQEIWHATTALDKVYDEGVKARQEVEGAGPALGGGGGQRVSTTYRYEHALEIARRLKFASQAARNEVTNGEILDHFAQLYGDDYYTMAKVLGANPAVDASGVLKLSTKGKVKLPGGIDDHAALAAWMERGNTTGELKYRAVQDLDAGLQHIAAPDEFTGAVILAGAPEHAAQINPEQVGVVKLAARKGARAPDGADQFELEFASADLKVVDDRASLDALASDEEGLLAQLRATLADQPKEGQLTIADHLVGGNGVAPGMETRARQILTRLQDLRDAKVDGGPTFNWLDETPATREAFRQQLRADGWQVNPEASIAIQHRMDGTTRERLIGDLYDETQRREGAAASFEQIAGTPEAMFERVIPDLAEAATETGWRGRAWETFKHPVGFKLEKGVLPLQIKLGRDEFPSWLRLSGNDGVAQAFRESGVPETRWLDWLIEDRVALDKWLTSGDQSDFQALLAHAGDNEAMRGTFDELYASPEWGALSALIAAGMKSAGQEAFGVHFFAPYRSALERSINHPLLGLYPASWSLKAAREWGRFLYNNRTLGIDIGMAPAQAIAQIVHAQHAAFAQMNDQDLDTWLANGPLGSPIFIFNLIMPGDWGSLPFTASRTIRDYARPLASGGPLPDAGQVFANNLRTIGLTRDARLLFESLGQIGDLLRGPTETTAPAKVLQHSSIRGGEYLTYDPVQR